MAMSSMSKLVHSPCFSGEAAHIGPGQETEPMGEAEIEAALEEVRLDGSFWPVELINRDETGVRLRVWRAQTGARLAQTAWIGAQGRCEGSWAVRMLWRWSRASGPMW
jgi:hypothetical protein